MEKLLNLLKEKGGKIKSSNDFTPDQIALAKADSRMYIDVEGFGFIWTP